ncbi:MAG: MBL fold metallo-hydrolase [Acidobacteriota bacterium]
MRSLLLAGFLAGAWTARTQTPVPAEFTVKQFKPDLFVIEGTSNGSGDVGNVTIYVTGEGVILVDDRFEQEYAATLATVRKVTSEPVKYIFSTHHHGDHTGGNPHFLPGVEIIAQANARRHMVDGKMPGIPRVSFTQEASVFLGGKEVRAIYNGRGHTDGDVAVFFPQARAVALGDLMAGTNGVTNPVMDYASGGSIKSWPATLDGSLKLEVDTVIPGHGAVTNKAGLQAHREKVAAILKRATQLVGAKTSKDEMTRLLVAEFDYKPINLRGLDGMMAELQAK